LPGNGKAETAKEQYRYQATERHGRNDFCKNNLATRRLEVIFTASMNVITTYTKHSIKMPSTAEGA
jgi:hypothetical protein